jgi:hypothetical protein
MLFEVGAIVRLKEDRTPLEAGAEGRVVKSFSREGDPIEDVVVSFPVTGTTEVIFADMLELVPPDVANPS